jgi:1,6-anhydro-N-acetylmuramate kinase
VIIDVHGSMVSFNKKQYDEIAIPLHIRSPILNILHDQQKNRHDITQLHEMLGHMLSTTIESFCKPHNVSFESIDLVRNATLRYSSPRQYRIHYCPARRTLLILYPDIQVALQANSNPALAYGPVQTNPDFRSEAAVVANETGITTASNLAMTKRPMNRSGPFSEAAIDSLFLQHPTKFRVCLTINDLIYVTILPPSESHTSTTLIHKSSTACGPGTMFIDYAMRYVTSNELEQDHDGDYGARGNVNQSIVDTFLATHDYEHRSPPMNIAFEMFGEHEVQSLLNDCVTLGLSDHDIIATITRITAENVLIQYRRLMATLFPDEHPKVDDMFICGPGATNMNIIDHLEDVLPQEIVTRPLDDIGIPGAAKDGVRCAQLGLETVLTYAEMDEETMAAESQNAELGDVGKGKNWEAVREQIQRFGQGAALPAIERVVVVQKETKSVKPKR